MRNNSTRICFCLEKVGGDPVIPHYVPSLVKHPFAGEYDSPRGFDLVSVTEMQLGELVRVIWAQICPVLGKRGPGKGRSCHYTCYCLGTSASVLISVMFNYGAHSCHVIYGPITIEICPHSLLRQHDCSLVMEIPVPNTVCKQGLSVWTIRSNS